MCRVRGLSDTLHVDPLTCRVLALIPACLATFWFILVQGQAGGHQQLPIPGLAQSRLDLRASCVHGSTSPHGTMWLQAVLPVLRAAWHCQRLTIPASEAICRACSAADAERFCGGSQPAVPSSEQPEVHHSPRPSSSWSLRVASSRAVVQGRLHRRRRQLQGLGCQRGVREEPCLHAELLPQGLQRVLAPQQGALACGTCSLLSGWSR